MPPHRLTNFEIQKCYQTEAKLNGAHAKTNLPKIQDGACVINLDQYEPIETHCIASYVNGNNIIYFDSFGANIIPKEIKEIIANKSMITNIYRMQAYDLIMCGYCCIGFIDFMLKGKSLLDYKNLFSLNDYKQNDEIILKSFRQLKQLRRKNYTVLYLVVIKSLKKVKLHTSQKKHQFLQ